MSIHEISTPAAMQRVAEAIESHRGPFVILAHENPDGDALGSVLGLARFLRRKGHTVHAPMKLPAYLQFVPKEGELQEPLETWPEDCMAIVLDVDNNTPERVYGADLNAFSGPVVNVDHHGTNHNFNDGTALAAWVDPAQASATQMIAALLKHMNADWDEEISTPLLLGLITDTGSFQFSNTTPATLRTAADLLESGAALAWLNDGRMQNPPSHYRLLGEALSKIEFLHDGKVVMLHVTEEILNRAGATWDGVDPLVGLVRNAEGCLLAVLVKDQGDVVKFSMRSRGGVSAQNVAVALGGGGHVPAAGAKMAMPYAEALPLLQQAIADELTRHANEA